MKTDRSFVLVLLCFFLSGFAALLYQTAWTREFSFVFGTSELAIATVLAGYMAGLALGAAVAGRFIHRVRRPILVYALLELGIAGSALALPSAIDALTAAATYWFSQSDGPPAAGGTGLTLFYFGTSFACLLIPTAFMGATLPLLSRHAVRRDAELGRRVGGLYAVNTLGAIVGTLVAGFLLLPELGLMRTVLVGVAANVVVFLLAAALSKGRAQAVAEVAKKATKTTWRLSDLVLPLILLSGLSSFAYEILWTRLLSQILGGSIYAFSTMLASFLAGITLGSALASRYCREPRTAALGFGLSQLAIAFFSVLAFVLVDSFPALVIWLQADQVAGVRPAEVALCAALLLPSTLAIGATFPFAVRIVARGPEDAASATARVYSWNTVGAILGAVGAGFFLIPAVGFATSLALMVALNLVLAALSSMALSPLRPVVLATSVVFLVLLGFVRPETPWNLLRFSALARQSQAGEIEFYQVGRGASVLVINRAGSDFLSTNGLPEAAVRPADDSAGDLTNRWLSAFPTMARPETRSLLVVGLGGGVVVEEVPSSVEEIDVIELEPAVVEANRAMASRRFRDPLSDPRVRVIENDARVALMLTARQYDGIVSQPSHPWTAGASHLYTKEFFELVKERLTPGGVFVQWIGLGFVDEELLRVLVSTLLDVFPNVRVYSPPPYAAVIFAASEEPLNAESTVSRAIDASPETFRRMGIQGPEDVFISLELDEEGAREFAHGAPVSTDDENILQTRSPKILGQAIKKLQGQKFFSRYDPSQRLVGEMDSVYVADRMRMRRRGHPRLSMLAEAAGGEGEARLVKLTLSPGYGRESRLQALEAMSSSREVGYRAAELMALALESSLRRRGKGSDADRLRAEALPEPARTVTKGWSALSEPSEIEKLEPQLARVKSSDLLYPAAIRLRAHWRVARGDPQLAAEAKELLNGTTAGQDGTVKDFILKGHAAALSGDTASALRSYEHAMFRARFEGSGRAKALLMVKRQLDALPTSGSDRSYRNYLLTQIQIASQKRSRF